MATIHSYRAYLLSAHDHIRSVTALSGIDDPNACLEAEILLRGSDHAAVEIWDERRLVCHIDKSRRVA